MPQGSSELELDQIGHYQIRQKIAEGGFGTVYLAHDPRLKRDVAIKLLHPHHATEPTRVARFLREARSAARLQHPGIVQVHDVIESSGRMALVMEYVEGRTLDIFLKENPLLSLEQKLDIAAQVAEALDAAHQAGIIHRDVKPANIIVDDSGKARLTDFSLARLLDSSLTQLTGDNNVIGTPAYMSPEQCEGLTALPQSDVYSLGIIIYEMATGDLPFEAENYLALLRHHMDTPPTPVRLLKPSLPVVLEELILRCLAKSPEDRPASGTELAQALRRIIADGITAVAAADDAVRRQAKTVELRSQSEAKITPFPSAKATPSPQPRHTPQPAARLTPVPDGAATPQPQPRQEVADIPSAETTSDDVLSTVSEVGQTPVPGAPPPQPEPPPPARIPAWGRIPGWAKGVAIGAVAVVVLAAAYLLIPPTDTDSTPYPISPTGSRPHFSGSATPLAEYVNLPDDNFAYGLYSTIPGEGYSAYVLDLTSQTWNADKVKPPVWRHWLTIIVPDRSASEKALLVCAKGLSAAEQPLAEVPESLAEIALTTRSIVAILEGFPRDPIGFYTQASKTDEMDPDDFAVASFQRFLDTGDPKWPVVCPIVKSVVRAMDTVQYYVSDELQLATPVKGFVLTGAANGWATWLTGAVDNRVVGIAPIEFDPLNMGEQIEHEVAVRGASLSSRGAFSPFFARFSAMGLMPAFDTEMGQSLLRIIDPYEYRDRLTMPKLLVLSASNPTTTPDGASLYFDELEGEKYLFYVANKPADHQDPLLVRKPVERAPAEEDARRSDAGNARPSDPSGDLADDESAVLMAARPAPPKERINEMRDTVLVFYHNMLVGKPMPRFTASVQPDGTFQIETTDHPTEVRLWVGESDIADFSRSRPGKPWTVESVRDEFEGTYTGKVASAKSKYRAFYLELVYPSKLGLNFSLTTPISVLPPQDTHTRSAAPSRVKPQQS